MERPLPRTIMQRPYYLLGWGWVALCCALIARSDPSRADAPRASRTPSRAAAPAEGPVFSSPATDAADWFRRAKPYCNAVELTTVAQGAPPPATVEGTGFHAACFALAGHIDDARRAIDALPPNERYRAAGIVFEVGHPVADAGDDRAAGPIMELVVDYWPNHYMALYHAGMAEYMLGQRDLARLHLTKFRVYYHEQDGWTQNAVDVLRRLAAPDAAPVRRPADPGGA